MSSKFFGNSKDKRLKPHEDKKITTHNTNKRSTAVRKTGRGK